MTLLRFFHFSSEIWGALFCLVAFVTILMTRRFDKKGADKLMTLMLCSALLLASDALAWWYRSNPGENGYFGVRLGVFAAFLFGFLIMPLTAEYVSHLISVRSGAPELYWKYIEWALCIIGIAMLFGNLFHEYIYSFDSSNTYYRLSYGFMPGMLVIIGITLTLGVAVEYVRYLKKVERIAVILFLILPLIGTVIQTIFYGVSLAYLCLAVSALILFFSYLHNYIEFNAEKEKLLTEERIRLFNHQIQPHFIFNSLAVIRHLIGKSQQEAIESLNEFSGYLRSCTDFLNESNCIPVSRELDLVRHYLYMEKKRFGDDITIIYDIEDEDFQLPPFAIQTMVENAVTHGLRAAGNGNGKITISARREGNNHVVRIIDNGAGFDTGLIDESAESHTGIRNTEQRLYLLCRGSLDIKSCKNEGTAVTITVPCIAK